MLVSMLGPLIAQMMKLICLYVYIYICIHLCMYIRDISVNICRERGREKE